MRNSVRLALFIFVCGLSVFPAWANDTIRIYSESIKTYSSMTQDESTKKALAGCYAMRAYGYAEENKYSMAIEDLRAAINLNKDPDYFARLAEYLAHTGDRKEAYSVLDSAISSTPKDKAVPLYVMRSKLLKEDGKEDNALSELNVVPKDPKSAFELAQLSVTLYRPTQAIEAYKIASKDDGYTGKRACIELAEYLSKQGQDQEALEWFTQSIKREPENIWYRAQFYQDRCKFEEALKDYNEYVPLCIKTLSSATPELKKYAVDNLKRAFEKRAIVLRQLGRYDQALSDYGELIQVEPENLDLYLKRYLYLSSLGRTEEALNDLNKMISISPVEGHNKRAWFYNKIMKIDLAQDDYNQMIKIAQGEADSASGETKSDKLGVLATTYTIRADFNEINNELQSAVDDMTQAIKTIEKKLDYVKPEEKYGVQAYLSGLYLNRAQLLEKQGKKTDQSADLQEALVICQRIFDQSTPEERDKKSWIKNRLCNALFAQALFKLKNESYQAGIPYMDQTLVLDKSNIASRVDYHREANKFEQTEADCLSYVALRKQAYDYPPKRENIYYDPKQAAKNEYITALRGLVSVYKHFNKLDKVVDTCNQILAISPTSGFAFDEKIRAFEKLGSTEKVNLTCEEAAATWGKPYCDEYVVGEALYKLKRYEKAFESLNASLAENESDSARYFRAKTCIALGNNNQAKSDMRQVLYILNSSSSLNDYGKSMLADAQSYLKSVGEDIVLAAKKLPSKQTATASNSSSKPASTPAATSSSLNQPIKDKWALVIGISNFELPGHNLKCAAKDAEDFYKYLVTEAGFRKDHVCLLLNEKATRKNIMAAFGSRFLPAVTEPGDLVVIFISTHGTPAEKDNGKRNFIVAYDTDPADLYPTGVDMDELYSRIKEGVNTDRALIVMDTCYSGAGIPGKGLDESANFDAKQIAAGCGRLVITSSANNEKSYESGNSGNGVFTKYFLQALRESGGKVEVKKAFESAKEKVRWEVKSSFNKSQIPQLGGEWEGKELLLTAPVSNPRPSFARGFIESFAPSTNTSKPNQNPTAGIQPATKVLKKKK